MIILLLMVFSSEDLISFRFAWTTNFFKSFMFEFDLQITRITLRSCTTFSVVAARERQEQLSPQFHAIGTGYVLVEDMVSLFSHSAQFGMNHNNALEDFCIWLAKLFENTQQIRGWETKQKLCLKGLWWYYGTVDLDFVCLFFEVCLLVSEFDMNN